MSRILVIGAQGRVGARLADTLERLGHTVFAAPKWMYWSYGLGYFSNFVFNRLNFWETARWSH